MVLGSATNDPNKTVVFSYELSGKGFFALMQLSVFYKEESSKIIDRLVREKAAELGLRDLE